MVQCYWWNSRYMIYIFLQTRVNYFNTYTISYEACVLGWWGELKIRRGDFKQVKFVIMMLDGFNIWGGGEGKYFCDYVVGCVWGWWIRRDNNVFSHSTLNHQNTNLWFYCQNPTSQGTTRESPYNLTPTTNMEELAKYHHQSVYLPRNSAPLQGIANLQ